MPMPRTSVRTTTSLTPAQRAAVQVLGDAAARSDGVAALSEQTLLSVAGDIGPSAGDAPRAVHVLAYAGDDLAGYAHLGGGAELGGGKPWGELVVTPAARRQGFGALLWRALSEREPGVRVWAHGSLPAAQAFAAAIGLVVVRELHKMARPLTPDDATPVPLPDGFRARTFVPGRDEGAWLAANAEAFADHPEQGRLRRADLAERMAQPWFRAEDLLIVEHEDTPGEVAAFHWTKIEQPGHGDTRRVGEVYALGVRPAYQGRGLAEPLTRLGLAHLVARGSTEAVLYVDGDNAAALSTYRRAGFRSIMVDVMYSCRVDRRLPGKPA